MKQHDDFCDALMYAFKARGIKPLPWYKVAYYRARRWFRNLFN